MLGEIQGAHDGAVAFEPVAKISPPHAIVHYGHPVRLDPAQPRLLPILHAPRLAMDEDSNRTVIVDICIHGFFDVALGPGLH